MQCNTMQCNAGQSNEQQQQQQQQQQNCPLKKEVWGLVLYKKLPSKVSIKT